MITGSDKRTSQQCSQIFVDFMLDYPHEPKALQQRRSVKSALGHGHGKMGRSPVSAAAMPSVQRDGQATDEDKTHLVKFWGFHGKGVGNG